ncbi:hypothetical protein D3C72_1001780 [compost metagenome]
MQRVPGRSIGRHAVEVLAVGLCPVLLGAFAGLLVGKILVVAGSGNQRHIGGDGAERAEELAGPVAAGSARVDQIARHHEACHGLGALRGNASAVVVDHALGDVLEAVGQAVLGVGDDGKLGAGDAIAFLGPGLELERPSQFGRRAGAGHHGILIQRVRLQTLQIGKKDAVVGKIAYRIDGGHQCVRARAAGLAQPDGGGGFGGFQHHRHAVGAGVLQGGAHAQRGPGCRIGQLGRVERRGGRAGVYVQEHIVHGPVPVVGGAAVVPADLCGGRIDRHGQRFLKGLVQRIGSQGEGLGAALVEADDHVGGLRRLALAVVGVEAQLVLLASGHVDGRGLQRCAVDLGSPQAVRFDQCNAIRSQGELTAFGGGVGGFLGSPGALVQKFPAQPGGRTFRHGHLAFRSIAVIGAHRPAGRRGGADRVVNGRRVEVLGQRGCCLRAAQAGNGPEPAGTQ